MEIIRDPKQLKPAPAGGGVGQPPSPPNRPFAPGDPLDDGDGIWRIGRNDHFGAGLYHAGNNRVVGQRGEYYDHTPRPLGIQGLAQDMSKGFNVSKKGFNYSQGVREVDESTKQDQDKKWSEARSEARSKEKKAPQKPLKEGPPKPPAKKKV